MAELIWDGKYDEHGNKRAPVRIELPFQTVETVNESVQDRQRTLELSSSGHDPEWRNRLIWGDKKYVLPSLLPEFAGKVDLIYIDPPFDTGADFSYNASLPNDEDGEPGEEEITFVKQPSVLEQKAYRDTWGRGYDSYFQWLYETAVLFRDLLAETGSVYFHFDWRAAHGAKVMLDEVFGRDNFLNNVVWSYQTRHSSDRFWNRKHDDLLLYKKTDHWTFNWTDEEVMQKLSPVTVAKYRHKDEKGFYRLNGRFLKGSPIKGAKDVDDSWEKTHPELVVRDYLRPGIPPNDSFFIPIENQSSDDRTGYPTQKPSALLRKLVKASSSESDLVLDCFCGSGTTAAVAEKLNRRWIACDLGRFAIHTTRKRLLGIPGVKPFVVQNLGKYERQAWQVAEFATSASTVILSGAKDPMSAGAQQRPGKEFSAPPSDRGENAPQGRLSEQGNKGSFDSRTRFASESGSSAQDDRVNAGAQGDRVKAGAQDDRVKAGAQDDRVKIGAQDDRVKIGAHDDRVKAGAQDDRVKAGAQDDRLREQREREANYRKFILELYHATPVSGHVWLHGVKGGRMVHVGAVDAPVTRADVNAIAAEVWKAAGKGPNSPQKPAVDVLGWEFALEINETAKEVAAQARVDAAFKKISRDVMEKKAVEQGDVHFFELGALSVDAKIKKRELTLKLSDFVIPLDDVPEEVRGAIKHWSQMVDYWAVDWDFKDDTFHNQWQSYRTRKNPKLELSVVHEYAEPGKYMVVVKVIDILGNDTTKTLQVDTK